MKFTPKQFQIMEVMERKQEATITDFDGIQQTRTAINAHLKRLIKLDQVHICRWVLFGPSGEMPIYKFGSGHSVTRAEARESLKEQRRALKEQPTPPIDEFDPANPRADVAAAWMFNPRRENENETSRQHSA
jgi:hypothetical protein